MEDDLKKMEEDLKKSSKWNFNANFFNDTFRMKNLVKYGTILFSFIMAIFHEKCAVDSLIPFIK